MADVTQEDPRQEEIQLLLAAWDAFSVALYLEECARLDCCD